MADYRTGLDLQQAVLTICGELTDGTSTYGTDVVTYLNQAYKGVLTGGNIFGTNVADPWSWATAKRPAIITLQPAIQNVAISTTQFSNNITFNTVPLDITGAPISVQGWWFNISGEDEWYRIVQHTVNTLTAQIDSPFTDQAITAGSGQIVLLDYDLVDNSIVIDQNNCFVDFSETGAPITATLPQGIYTPDAFATLVASTLSSTGSFTYSGSWNSVTRLFSWTSSGVFSFLNASGPNSQVSASEVMGFDCLDLTAAQAYTSTYPLNAINRLTAPMVCYHKVDYFFSMHPKNTGKIFEVSYNTFIRDYPMILMRGGSPDKFCITSTGNNGIVSVRFNAFFYNLAARVEIGYIPKRRAIQANAASIPVVPEEHRSFLVNAASTMIMADKSDARKAEREKMATDGLQALQHSDRKDKSLAGIDYAKLVPRPRETLRNKRWLVT